MNSFPLPVITYKYKEEDEIIESLMGLHDFDVVYIGYRGRMFKVSYDEPEPQGYFDFPAGIYSIKIDDISDNFSLMYHEPHYLKRSRTLISLFTFHKIKKAIKRVCLESTDFYI